MDLTPQEEIKRLRESNRILRDALRDLVTTYVANYQDPQSQFIRCITPPDIPKYWQRAMRLLGFRVKT